MPQVQCLEMMSIDFEIMMMNESKIFISQQKKDVLAKIEKIIINNTSSKIVFGKNYNFFKNIRRQFS